MPKTRAPSSPTGAPCWAAGPAIKGSRVLVNAAGLHAEPVARSLDGVLPSSIPRCTMIKGNYFSMLGRAPFSRLIYPVPQEATLGVHVTLDLAGRVRFGPDREAVEAIDYTVDPGRADSFYDSVRKFFPGLPDGALQPDYAGIRITATAPDPPGVDFIIQGPAEHGIPGLVNLFGIESPGLTASLAIADHVAELLAASPPSRSSGGRLRWATGCDTVASGRHGAPAP